MIDSQRRDIHRCRFLLHGILYVGNHGSGRKYYRGIFKTGGKESQHNEEVELVCPAKTYHPGMEKLDTHPTMYCIGRHRWRVKTNTHQLTEWNIDPSTLTIYRYHEGMRRTSAYGIQRQIQIDLTELYAVEAGATEAGGGSSGQHLHIRIQECFHALRKHIRQ
jgi:hypothetical protein